MRTVLQVSCASLVFSLPSAHAADQLLGSYGFGPTQKSTTSIIDIRDPKGELWPAIYDGRAEPSQLVFTETGIEGSLTIAANAGSLLHTGNQNRLIGEIIKPVVTKTTGKDGKVSETSALPLPRITLSQLTAPDEAELKKNGRNAAYTYKGNLSFADAVVTLAGPVKITTEGDNIAISFTVTFKGKALGLVKYADRDVVVNVSTKGKSGIQAFAPKGSSKIAVPTGQDDELAP